MSNASLRISAEGIWELNYFINFPFGVQLPVRSHILRLASGRLCVISPGPSSVFTRQVVDDLGLIGTVIAPSLFHHLHIAHCQSLAPQAEYYAPPGMDRKRKDVRWSGFINDRSLFDWRRELNFKLVDGIPHVNELVFHHKPSRSLIVTDLAFHFTQATNLPSRLLFASTGCWRRLQPSRYLRWQITDRKLFRRSMEEILSWDFNRIIVSHGQNVENKAKALLTDNLRRLDLIG